jgi:hypothetical protein
LARVLCSNLDQPPGPQTQPQIWLVVPLLLSLKLLLAFSSPFHGLRYLRTSVWMWHWRGNQGPGLKGLIGHTKEFELYFELSEESSVFYWWKLNGRSEKVWKSGLVHGFWMARRKPASPHIHSGPIQSILVIARVISVYKAVISQPTNPTSLLKSLQSSLSP